MLHISCEGPYALSHAAGSSCERPLTAVVESTNFQGERAQSLWGEKRFEDFGYSAAAAGTQ